MNEEEDKSFPLYYILFGVGLGLFIAFWIVVILGGMK
jgi:hypothetical protein